MFDYTECLERPSLAGLAAYRPQVFHFLFAFKKDVFLSLLAPRTKTLMLVIVSKEPPNM